MAVYIYIYYHHEAASYRIFDRFESASEGASMSTFRITIQIEAGIVLSYKLCLRPIMIFRINVFMKVASYKISYC